MYLYATGTAPMLRTSMEIGSMVNDLKTMRAALIDSKY